ncbi:MAG: Ribosome association toxin RatA [Legionellaceae bacterium]
MPTIHRTAIVSHTPRQMYELVNAIEEYPQYLPWCKTSQILSKNEDEIRASLLLARGGVEKSFTTCNRLQKDKMIEIRLLNGPFHHLEGFWQFETIDGVGCRITLNLEFEFAGKLLSFAFSPVFNQVANTLVDAFVKQAKVLYGDK